MITLYQMPVSHFCEKIRWALSYKRLPHKFCSRPPGLHMGMAKKLSGQTALPIIKEAGTVVHGSSAIIDYLDEQFPRFPLTPSDPNDRQKAIAWEQWAGEEIGPAVRVLCYAVLLERPELLKPMLAYGGPWYSRFFLDRAYPKLKTVLESRLNIHEGGVSKATETLTRAVEKQLNAQSALAPILDSGFCRADLAIASLWAPMFQMEKFGVPWPETIPKELADFAAQFSDLRPWVAHIYAKYR